MGTQFDDTRNGHARIGAEPIGEGSETHWLWAPLGVVRYELQRSMTLPRIGGWALLAFFPVLLVGLAKWRLLEHRPGIPDRELTLFFSVVLFILIPQVVTVLSLLLWATPAINAELEGQTWIYAVVRPGGKTASVIGKCLVAILWTATAGWTSATLCVPITGVESSFRLWWTMMRLVALSSVAYGALYIALGTLVQRRAMVVAFLYTLIVEVILSFVPATINQLTVGFRLRSLAIQWQDLTGSILTAETSMLFELEGTARHLWILGLYVVVLLTVALARVRFGEYSLNAEAT